MAAHTPDGTGFLIRFEDGLLSRRDNVRALQGSGNFEVAQDLFGWPLPDRLATLAHDGAPHVALWDADNPADAELPDEITESPNVVVYRKISESQIAKDIPGVVRGAAYRTETS